MSLVSGNLPGDVGTFSLCPTVENEAKFCVLFSSIATSYASVIGFCVPPACTVDNITSYVTTNPYLNDTYQYRSIAHDISDYVFCSNEGVSLTDDSSATVTRRDITMIAILGTWITLLCLATAYDYVKGYTLSSVPWQLVRRNSDGNIVHVVQPPQVANRRAWRSMGGDGGGGGAVLDRLVTRSAAVPYRTRSKVWKRRSAKSTQASNKPPLPGAVQTGGSRPGDVPTAARSAGLEQPLLSDDQASREGSMTPPRDSTPERAMSPPPRPQVRGPSTRGGSHYGAVDAVAHGAAARRSVSPASPLSPVVPVAAGVASASSDAEGHLEETTATVDINDRTVLFHSDDEVASDDDDLFDRTANGSAAVQLSATSRLSATLTNRLESWFGEERLVALRERKAALRQYVSEKMESLPDLPDFEDLPNFQSIVVRGVLCMSLLNSFRKWRYYPTSQANINIFNSVRVLAWAWIVAVDTFEYTMHVPTYTTEINERNNPLYALVQRQGSASFAIGTFLIISGFTTMHRLITSEERPKSPAAIVMENSRGPVAKAWSYVVWYVKYFITRLVRVLPVYAAILFLLQPLLVRAGTGPFWPTFTTSGQLNGNCRDQWYTNLLLVNNFVPVDASLRCFPWSYYIALEFQLVLLAPFIHFAYKKMGYKWFLPTIIALAVGSMILRYFYFEGCRDTLLPPSRSVQDAGVIYEEPQFMIIPFLAGVGLYYAYRGVSARQDNIKLLGSEATMILMRHEMESKQIEVSDRASFWLLFRLQSKRFRVVSIWAGIAILLTCILASWSLLRERRCNDSPQARVFGSVAIFAWCVGLCLIILPMLFGFGGNVRRILIHRLWCGASRLVLSAYLLHPVVINFCNANKYAPVSMEFLLFLVDSWGNIGVSLIVAFCFHLGVEQPSIHLGS